MANADVLLVTLAALMAVVDGGKILGRVEKPGHRVLNLKEIQEKMAAWQTRPLSFHISSQNSHGQKYTGFKKRIFPGEPNVHETRGSGKPYSGYENARNARDFGDGVFPEEATARNDIRKLFLGALDTGDGVFPEEVSVRNDIRKLFLGARDTGDGVFPEEVSVRNDF